MSESRVYAKPDPTPLLICLTLAISLCLFFFFIGCSIVRLLFYKGALGPAPKKYVIVPLHRKKKAASHVRATSTGIDIEASRATSLHTTAAGNRKTEFPAMAEPPASPAPAPENPFSDEHAIPSSQPQWLRIPLPTFTIQGADGEDERAINAYEDFEDPDLVRAYIAEERRISRLPAFEQDDCGDGHEFPSVPYATNAVEALPSPSRSSVPSADVRKVLADFGLSEERRTGTWLTLHTPTSQMQAAREKLLDIEHDECVQARPEAEVACEELLEMVAHQLCVGTARFSQVTKNGKKFVRSQMGYRDYAVSRPYEWLPIEICARMAGEDFCVFVKDEFTQKWYLQASATTFPAGWHMSKYIGKSLSAIINNPEAPHRLWSNLPTILDALHSSPTLRTRTSTFIQRPQDLFSGSIHNLQPSNLYVRREFQTFRTLPKSGAIVMSTRTELLKLTDVEGMKAKRELLEEVQGWGEAEAEVKGRELVWEAVRAQCRGGRAFRDDETVLGD